MKNTLNGLCFRLYMSILFICLRSGVEDADADADADQEGSWKHDGDICHDLAKSGCGFRAEFYSTGFQMLGKGDANGVDFASTRTLNNR